MKKQRRTQFHRPRGPLRNDFLATQRRIQQQLRQQNEELITLMELMPVGVWIAHDRLCNVVTGNQLGREQLGMAPETMLTFTDEAFAPFKLFSDDQPLSPADLPLPTAARTGKPVNGFSFDVVFEDGTMKSFYGDATPLFDQDGSVSGAITTLHDVSDRRRTEQAKQLVVEVNTALSSSLDYQLRLETVARLLVPQGGDFCVIDILEADGDIHRVAAVHADPAQQQLLEQLPRYQPSDASQPSVARVITTNETMLLHQEDLDLLDDAHETKHLAIRRLLGVRTTLTVPLLAHSRVIGALSLCMSTSKRVFSAEMIAAIEEIGQRAGIALENARLYREAREAVQLRDAFLSVAAHELKTPLTSLLGNAQLLQRRAAADANLSERTVHSVQVIIDQARRLDKMIAMMLDISRIETGQLQIERIPFDIVALVRRLLTELYPNLKGHVLVSNLPDKPVIMHGDSIRLEQAIQNLLTNAVKYSPNGGNITVELTTNQRTIGLAICDEGMGISEKHLPQLFSRFYRADNQQNKHISGMGIGLYVVKEIITLHGGTITVDSAKGKGSTFTIFLPFGEPPESA